jgi:glycosyltransferase involved in cell wall biosynthesis
MKVLQISKFYPPVWGGIETAAWELSEGLARAGVVADVLCSNQQRATKVSDFEAGYRVVRAGTLGTVLSTTMAPPMVQHLRHLSRARDILHVHMPDPMAAAAVWLTRPAMPVVLHWHSDVIRQRRAMVLYEPLQTWLLARADAIIATSEAYAEASRPLQPWRDKVKVIPIGISDSRVRAGSQGAAAIRQRFGGRRLVFALGRMTYYKGFDVLIDAAASLPEDCAVLIGGAGDGLRKLEAQVVARGLAGKVRLLGSVTEESLPSYFEACDVFCLPSIARSEAYGVAMVEAMLMGKPIVATDIQGSGVPWVNQNGRTGINTPVGNAAELAQALRRLLDDEPMRRRLGEAARGRYLSEFTADLMTERTLSLYRRLLSARSAVPSARPAVRGH